MPKVLVYLPKELLSVWKKLKNKSEFVQKHLKKEQDKENKS